MVSDQVIIERCRKFLNKTPVLEIFQHHKWKIAVILFVTIGILSLSGDLWHFPFNLGVWGSASDSLTLLVTCFTAYYLVKTFREQQEITRIEQQNFRLQFLPKIIVEFSSRQITFKVENNAILKYNFYSLDSGVFKLRDDWMLHGERHMDLPVGHAHFIHLSPNDRRTSNVETLIFTFMDIQNNLYQQRVYIAASTYDVIIQTPKFIGNLKPNVDFQSAIQNIQSGIDIS